MDGYNTHTHKQSKHTQKEREITRKSSFLRRRQQPTPPNAKKIESRFLLIFPSWSWNRFFATHPSKEERKARNDATVGRMDGCSQQSFLDYIYIVHFCIHAFSTFCSFFPSFCAIHYKRVSVLQKTFFSTTSEQLAKKKKKKKKKVLFFCARKETFDSVFFLSFSLTKTRRRKDTRFGS